MLDSSTTVNQRGAAPGGDAVGRDKITNVHHSERRTQIDGWIDRLAEELRGNVQMRDFVDSLQYYFQLSPYDEHIGLVAKLDRAGRSAQKSSALRKKEAFSKLLEEWRSYPAAQEIIAYFLTKIETSFEVNVLPLLASSPAADIDTLIQKYLVDPVMAEMGCGPFMLNYNHVLGMVYWLAEQCYIRWHV
jgi:hypothetical protein